MTYRFQVLQEAAWAAFVGLGAFLLSVFVIFEPSDIDDWEAWAIALGAGSVRAVAAALIAFISKSGSFAAK